MGAVYRATQLSVQRTVALKVVRPDLDADDVFIDRFFREANVIAGLSHPNIIRLIDFGQDPDRDILYLVMELVHGLELGDLIALGRLNPPLALEVTYQVLAGLTQPHARGIVHRALQPANLIILPSSDGTVQVKVLDFGIARPLQEATQLTQTGMICGTPSYLSPEQAQSEPALPQSDLYSLGIILFEMLTGHRPFRGPSGLHLLFDHVQRPAPDLATQYPESIPKPLSDFVLRLLEKSPADRPESAILARREIQELRQTLSLDPVFLDSPDDDDLEASFSPWLADALDPDRLDDDSPPSPSSPDNKAFLTTLDPIPPENATEIALTDTTPRVQQSAEPTPDPVDDPPQNTASETDSSRPTTTAVREAIQAHPVVSASLATVTAIAVLATLVLLSILFFDDRSQTSTDETTEAAVAHTGSTDDVQEPSLEPPAHSPTEDLETDFSYTEHTLQRWETFSLSTGHEAPESVPEDSEADEIDDADVAPPAPEPPSPPSEPSDEPTEVASARGPEMPDLSADAEPADTPPSSPSGEGTPAGLTHQGSVTLESPSQLDFIDHYEEITGDLVIRINTGDISELSLNNLIRLRGSLIIDGLTQLETIALPNLERVGQSVMMIQNHSTQRLLLPALQSTGENFLFANTSLHEIDVQSLSSIGGMIQLSRNTDLGELGFPALENVTGSISILENSGIHTLTFPTLDSIGEELQILSGDLLHMRAPRLSSVGRAITVNRTMELQTLDLSSLQQVNSLFLNEVPALNTLSLGALRRVNRPINISETGVASALKFTRLTYVGGQLTLSENPYISSIELSSLETLEGTLIINDHPELRELHLPDQSPLDELRVNMSPKLNACPLQSLVAQWEDQGWTGVSGLNNLDDSECS